MRNIFLLSLLLVFPLLGEAQTVINLWPDGVPTKSGLTGPETTRVEDCLLYSNVTEPQLLVYPAKNPNGMAFIMCPGGGYNNLAMDHEGWAMADWFNSMGITYAVLKYRMPNRHHEIPVSDALKAIEILRGHKADWGVNYVGIGGASAGGHLTSTAATHYTTKENRPDYQLLFYPVTTTDKKVYPKGTLKSLFGENAPQNILDLYSNEKQVTNNTPPAFIMHCTDDDVVPVANSLMYYEELVRHNVDASLHIYPEGGHGWGYWDKFKFKKQWTEELEAWLRYIGKKLKDGNVYPATPPANVTDEMDLGQMLWQIGNEAPALPSPEFDSNRPSSLSPVEGKLHQWKHANGENVNRSRWGLWTNYDDNSGTYAPGADSARSWKYSKIDLLQAKNGKRITSAQQWYKTQRPQIMKDVERELLGTMPDKTSSPKVIFSSKVSEGEAEGFPYIEHEITGKVDCSSYPELRNKPEVKGILRLPANKKGKVPVMVLISSPKLMKFYWKTFAEQGWGLCMYEYEAVQPDKAAANTDYFIGLLTKGNWRKPSDIGGLGAWAWGASRLIDYLYTIAQVNRKAICISGHSRCGKAALYCMAWDERISLGFPSDAGCGGTKMNRRHYGEDLEFLPYYWLCGNALSFCGPMEEGGYLPRKVEKMTVDAHSVISLCAPRPVFINGGTTSRWADPWGMYAAAKEASPVWELLGKKGCVMTDKVPQTDKAYIDGTIGYRYHEGGHVDFPEWPSFFIWAKKQLKL